MKKTQRTDAYRGIVKRIVSFLSIVLIAAIACTSFFMTDFMAKGLSETGSGYYDGVNYMDLKMFSSLGANDKQIEEIRKVEGVEDVEGVVEVDGKVGDSSDMVPAVFLTSTRRINVPGMIEGRMPMNANECAVSADLANVRGWKIFDRIRVSSSYGDKEIFKNGELVITGICNHPDYVRSNVTYAVLIDKSLVDEEVMNGLYTRVVVVGKDIDANTFSDTYFSQLQPLKDRLTAMLPGLETSSVNYVRGIAEEKIDAMEEEVNRQIADAQAEIDKAKDDANKQLNAAWRKITDGQKELDDAYNRLTAAEEQIADAEKQLQDAIDEYERYKKKVKKYGIDVIAVQKKLSSDKSSSKSLKKTMDKKAYKSSFDTGKRDDLISDLNDYINVLSSYNDLYIKAINTFKPDAQVDETFFTKRMQDAENLKQYMLNHTVDGKVDGSDPEFRKLFDRVDTANTALYKRLDFVVGKIGEYRDADAEIAAAKQKIADGKWEVADGWLKYEDGKARLEAAKKEYNRAKKKALEELAAAQAELDEKAAEAAEEIAKARKDLEGISCNWLITDRRAETGYNDLRSNIQTELNAGKIFGILFALVGGLVCFSTLIIIIEEDKKNVGTSKAFGFYNSEILGKYLIFGGASAFLGCLLAFVVSVYGADIVQGMIDKTGIYNIGRPAVVVDYRSFAIVSVIVVLLALAVSVLSCMGLLRSPASVLMKGQTLSSGKKREKNSSSSRWGSLYSRLILRNMSNDKARVFITIIIVAGSVFVVGTGINVRDAFQGMLDTQVAQVEKYDYRADIGDNVSADERKEIEAVFKRNGVVYSSAAYKGVLYLNEGRLDGINLMVIDDDKANGFINIVDPVTKEKVHIPEHGVLAQNRIVENKKLTEGDEFVLYDGSLTRHAAAYSGQFNNYIGRLLIMSRSSYVECFGEKVKDNCYYMKLGDASFDQIREQVAQISDDVSFFTPDSTVKKYESVTNLYNIVVVMMLVFAIIMSFMILTNLANIFISRKKKELIVMRINGFSIGKTKRYLAIETLITTLVGLGLGLLAGLLFSKFMIMGMEQPDTQFIRTFDARAWLIAVAVEAFFALVIYTLSFRKINNLNFREIT